MLGSIPELMEFPSKITFKVFGSKPEVVEPEIHRIFEAHNIKERTLEQKVSEKGNWYSFSVTFTVESAEQMETLYKELAAIESVKMVI